ncbi:MAG: hypothetical protein DRI83_07450 [Bacteroidetes bacterium]|nr:MAG: hypothetical protein DRI83_07450 [Bacteroidota bacterium]
MNRKLNQFVAMLQAALGLLLSISFAIFLFVLFFEPFPLDGFALNNGILFVAAMGAIAFVIMSLVRITLPWLIKKYDQHQFDPLLPPYANSFLIYVLTFVSFTFYIRYVGSIDLSISIMFKMGLLSLAPPVSLWLHDLIKDLKKQNKSLRKEIELAQGKVEQYEEDYLSKAIEFISDSSTETFSLLMTDVAFVKSADNYVEIVYREGDTMKSKLIRNTLKNIELQLKTHPNFIRCHRTCIVNMHHVEKLNKDINTYWLTIKSYSEHIPVSRQYLLKLKESI